MTAALIKTRLSQWIDPYARAPLSDVASLQVADTPEGPAIDVVWHYAMQSRRERLEAAVADEIAKVVVDGGFRLSCRQSIVAVTPGTPVPAMAGIRNILCVASGKGGVGKSTTAVNLALALADNGARTGILDADIYGPSVPLMLGVSEGVRPQVVNENSFRPVPALGLQTMSMGYLVTANTPMVWRGPMVSGALIQLLTQTLWDDLDYLVIDMPPGTGDIQLTLSQKVPVSGAVIVTTPQNVALLDARKGIEMFRKVNVPVLGIVENMATHTCTQCGHTDAVFGEGGGERIAADYDTRVVGRLPLSGAIREQTDRGQPPVVAEPAGVAAEAYRELAVTTAAALAVRAAAGVPKGPTIRVVS